MADPVRYTAEDMDGFIRASQSYKAHLRKAGHIDRFGSPVKPQPAPAEASAPEPVSHDAYCVKCKTMRTVQTKSVEPHPTNPNGAGRAVGDCPVCGTTTHVFRKAQDAKKLKDALESTRAQTSTGR